MRKRNIHIQCWLDKREAEHLRKMVERSGLTREAYLRHLINGVVPQDAPPPDYFGMMNELRQIGNQLDRAVHQPEIANAVQQLDQAILTITDAVLMPRKRE